MEQKKKKNKKEEKDGTAGDGRCSKIEQLTKNGNAGI